MTLKKFVDDSGLVFLSEVERACHLAFYHLKKAEQTDFSATDCCKWLDSLHLGKSNASRLAGNLKVCRHTVKGAVQGCFRLHHNYINKMEEKYPKLSEKSQEVVDDGTILPPILYSKTRGFIESVAKQINSNYEHNTFDGCTVLMRRLEEMLLILSYEHLGIESQIKDLNGNYQMLEGIVKNAVSNPKLNLSRNSKKSIEVFRELGNYSAHKMFYLAKREYVKEKIDEFRALIEELLHRSGLR